MAYGKRGGGSRQPKWSISFSVKVRDGEYKKGPSIGLWPADAGPMARGSCKGEYLDKLADFFDKYSKGRDGISVSLFENDGNFGGSSRSRHDDEGEERRSRRRDEEEDEPRSRRSGREGEEDNGEGEAEFSKGDSVTFNDDEGDEKTGEVLKVLDGNRLLIEDEDGEKHKVDADECEAAQEDEPEERKRTAKKAPAKKKAKKKKRYG